MGFEGLGDLMRSRCLSQETPKVGVGTPFDLDLRVFNQMKTISRGRLCLIWLLSGALRGGSADAANPPELLRNVVLVEAARRNALCQLEHVNDIAVQRSDALCSVCNFSAKLRNFDIAFPIRKSGFNGNLAKMTAIIETTVESENPRGERANENAGKGNQGTDNPRVIYARHMWQGAVIGYGVGLSFLFLGWGISLFLRATYGQRFWLNSRAREDSNH
jgi:hypothetical protein